MWFVVEPHAVVVKVPQKGDVSVAGLKLISSNPPESSLFGPFARASMVPEEGS